MQKFSRASYGLNGLLVLAIFLNHFVANSQGNTFHFGTSTSTGNNDGKNSNDLGTKMFDASTKSNRPKSRFITLFMERMFRTECNSSNSNAKNAMDCVTRMEWDTQMVRGINNKRHCHHPRLVGSQRKWLPFSIYQEEDNGNGEGGMFGLVTNLRSISIGQNFSMAFAESAKIFIPLLPPSSGANRRRLMVSNNGILQQIGAALNAKKLASGRDIWTFENCQEERGGKDLMEIELDGGLKIGMNAMDLVYQRNDSSNSCLLALSEFEIAAQFNGQDDEVPPPPFSLALSIFPHQCLLINLAENKVAMVPKRMAKVWEEAEDEEEEKDIAKRHREVSEGLSFLFSLI